MEKTVIKIWKGRAYLHQEFTYMDLPCEKDTPLGNDTKLIDKFIDAYQCKVIFLNDDFTEQKPSDTTHLNKKKQSHDPKFIAEIFRQLEEWNVTKIEVDGITYLKPAGNTEIKKHCVYYNPDCPICPSDTAERVDG